MCDSCAPNIQISTTGKACSGLCNPKPYVARLVNDINESQVHNNGYPDWLSWLSWLTGLVILVILVNRTGYPGYPG